MKEKLIVALDVDSAEQVERAVTLLKDEVGMFKIGMQVYNSLGRDVIKRVKELGGKVFLDLKLHDIPNTVAQATRVLTGAGVDLFNVHASGGYEMMKRAADAAREEAKRLDMDPPLVISVTVLTSLSDKDLDEIGFAHSSAELVQRLGMLSAKAGLDGVVCSPHEAKLIRDACGPEFITVTPGVRPSEAGAQDQKRIMTPKRAIENGAHYLVVGRPIMQADDPVRAARDIVKEMEEATC